MTPPLAQQLVVLRVPADVVIPEPGPPAAPVQVRRLDVRELQWVPLGPFSSASLAPSAPLVAEALDQLTCRRVAPAPHDGGPYCPRGLAWGPLIASWARLSSAVVGSTVAGSFPSSWALAAAFSTRSARSASAWSSRSCRSRSRSPSAILPVLTSNPAASRASSICGNSSSRIASWPPCRPATWLSVCLIKASLLSCPATWSTCNRALSSAAARSLLVWIFPAIPHPPSLRPPQPAPAACSACPWGPAAAVAPSAPPAPGFPRFSGYRARSLYRGPTFPQQLNHRAPGRF